MDESEAEKTAEADLWKLERPDSGWAMQWLWLFLLSHCLLVCVQGSNFTDNENSL